MTDDQLLLANAYVDDDLDAAERARAEADDEVMAEVARLRATVAALRDVEPPDPARRAAALAAAMRAAERPTPVAPPVPLRPRRTWAAAGIAAALVAVVIGGAVVLRATPGGDDDDSTSLEVRSAAQPESAADRSSAGAAATTVPTATTAASATADQSANEQAGSATTAAGGLVPTTTVPARNAAPEATGDDALTVLSAPDDLIAFAMEATPQTPPPGACTGGRYVAPASYAGVTPAVTVEVFVDGADAVARDAASCVEVARVPLP
jgi:hypothetical protein